MRNKLTTVILLIIALCANFAYEKSVVGQESCNWTQFGGNVAGTRCVPAECGPKSNKPTSIWEFKTNVDYCQTPLISGDYAVMDDSHKSIMCFNIKTGKLLWNAERYLNSSRKCTDSANFYMFDGLSKMVCLDLKNGVTKWTTQGFGAGSQLVVKDRKLYYGSSNSSIYCHSAENGSLLWSYKSDDRVFSTPSFFDDLILFGTYSSIYCIKADPTPKLMWKNSTIPEKHFSSPSVYDNKVYVIAGARGFTKESKVCSFDINQGNLLWSTTIPPVDISEIAVHDKYVVVGCLDSKLYCLDRFTGAIRWEFLTGDEIRCSPTIYGNNVIAGSDDGYFYCVDIETGKELWKKFTGTNYFDYAAIGKNKILLCGKSFICLGDDKDFIPNQTPARISITPEISKTYVNKKIQFKVEVFDEFGKIIPNCPVEWKASANSNIDRNGLFYTDKVGKYVITCIAEDIKKELLIEVVDAYEISPKNFEFTNMDLTSKYKGVIKIKNNTDEDYNVKINPSSDVLIINPKETTIKPNYTSEVNFEINLKLLKKGQVLSENVEVVFGDIGKISIPVKISVSENQEDCILATPSAIDFGYIERSKSKALSLNFVSPVPLKAKIIKIDDWLVSSKNEFNIDAPLSIEFTASTSKLPKGKDFVGEVVIETDQSWCKKITIPVKLQTDEIITISLTIDSKEAKINNSVVILDAPAQIIKGRTMVPLRFVAEAFGCNVNWNSSEGKATIQRGNIIIILTKGKTVAFVNGVEQKLDSPAVIVGGRTLVPIRFISEPFGAKVNFEAKTKTITIVWEPN